MNILIGKIGKSVRFGTGKISTGDDTCMIVLCNMSRMFPEHNFYLLGPNNLDKVKTDLYNKIFPNYNVFSVYKKGYEIEGEGPFNYDSIIDNIKEQNLNIDFGLFITGYVGTTCLAKCLRNEKTGEYLKQLLAFRKYVGPYVHVLNVLGIPYYTIAEDPRYITINTKELFNRENLIFTQYKDRLIDTYKHIKSYSDHSFTIDKVPIVYSEVERIFLMALDKNWKDNIDVERKLKNTKNPKCIVISNGHGSGKINTGQVVHNGRFKEYKKYIVDGLKGTPYEDTCIYGKWDDPVPQEYSQFKDTLLIDLKNEIADAKYSFVYSIIPGFVTIKPFEMIVKGLIPFLHPEYDKDHLLNLPEYLYVSSPQDLVEKMKYLDENPEEYKKLLNECLNVITPEYLDGSKIINFIMSKICEDLGIDYTPKLGVEPIMDHFKEGVINI